MYNHVESNLNCSKCKSCRIYDHNFSYEKHMKVHIYLTYENLFTWKTCDNHEFNIC
jgi:hypothetical protein